jgi:hypothetical protein
MGSAVVSGAPGWRDLLLLEEGIDASHLIGQEKRKHRHAPSCISGRLWRVTPERGDRS